MRPGFSAPYLVLGTVFAIGPRAWSAPALAPEQAHLVDCADTEQLRTRGIRVAPAKPAPSDSVLMSVRVFGPNGARHDASRQRGERAICPGATLVSGDEVRVSVWVRRRFYVYVVIARQDHSAALLYPSRGRSALVEADTEVSLPQSGEVFQLDDVTGTETFWVVGSTSRVSSDDGTLDDVLSSLSGVPAAPHTSRASKSPKNRVVLAIGEKASTNKGPDVAGLKTRGIVVKKDPTTLEVLSTDPMGIVVAPFWLRHSAP